MRLAFICDVHLREADAKVHGDILYRMAEQIESSSCDVLLIGGDLAGRTVPHLASPAERNLLVGFIGMLGLPTVIIRGNHDSLGDWDFLRALPDVYYEDEPVHLHLPDMVCRKSQRTEGLRVTCLPWLDDPDQLPDLTASAWTCDVVIGHANLVGGRIKPYGQPDVPKGDVFQINGAQVLHDTGAKVALFGHYHEPQEVSPGVFYGGSTFINDFGEPENRGWTFVDLEEMVVEHRTVEQPKRTLLEVPWAEVSAELVAIVGDLATPKELVKLRLRLGEGDLKEARAWAKEHFADNAFLRVAYDVIPLQRRREGSEEVSRAPSLEAKLRNYAATLSPPPRPDVLAAAFRVLPDVELSLEMAGEE
ncbi:MAG: hypothetical protein GY871_04140 [Actinomycetales bacterium]|nr:hypothetical protein [Actinomycetales bacterium]